MEIPTATPSPNTQAGNSRVGYFRWVVCASLFFATTINYIDRQALGLLKSTLQEQFKFSELDCAAIVFSF